eukprot:2739052-Rhodomonas_salina.2
MLELLRSVREQYRPAILGFQQGLEVLGPLCRAQSTLHHNTRACNIRWKRPYICPSPHKLEWERGMQGAKCMTGNHNVD